jgi:hypothetical protein
LETNKQKMDMADGAGFEPSVPPERVYAFRDHVHSLQSVRRPLRSKWYIDDSDGPLHANKRRFGLRDGVVGPVARRPTYRALQRLRDRTPFGHAHDAAGASGSTSAWKVISPQWQCPSIFMRLVPKWIVRGAIVDEAKARILAALALDDGS